MSVRRRLWKTAAGEDRHAWIVDYADQAGKRRMKTFRLKKEADAFETRSRFEITQGTHTPDSASITVAEAAVEWLETCVANNLETATIDFPIDGAHDPRIPG
jgi:integrase